MRVNWKKAVKVGSGVAMLGFGVARLMDRKTVWNHQDPFAWFLVGAGAAQLLQETLRVSEQAWDQRQELLYKQKSRYFPII